jgi:hypothetical protein
MATVAVSDARSCEPHPKQTTMADERDDGQPTLKQILRRRRICFDS